MMLESTTDMPRPPSQQRFVSATGLGVVSSDVFQIKLDPKQVIEDEAEDFTQEACLDCGHRTKILWEGMQRFLTCFHCGWKEELEWAAPPPAPLPASPLDSLDETEPATVAPPTPPLPEAVMREEGHRLNRIVFVNNHAEIVMKNQRALIDLQDVEKAKGYRWMPHPRGPITEIVLSRKPRQRKYLLLSMHLFGKSISAVDGNRFDLRRANVTDKQYRPSSKPRISKLWGYGVYRTMIRGEAYWMAQCHRRGKDYRKHFRVRTYGEEQAEQLAKQARAAMAQQGWIEAAERVRQLKRMPKLRAEHEMKSAPRMDPKGIRNLAKIYCEREKLPPEMIPHFEKMLMLGGGRMPKLENKKDLAPVNIYEGNQAYENCKVEIERDEETGEAVGFQPY